MSTPHVVAIAGRKGGVGKTTLTAALASVASDHGKRVLVIDVDNQANLAAFFGVDVGAKGIVDMLRGEDVEPIACPRDPNILVLPGSTTFDDDLARSVVDDALRKVAEAIPSDLVLIDCPPGREVVDRLALNAADTTLIVCEPTRVAVTGARRVLADVPAGRRSAIIIQKLDQRMGMHRQMRETASLVFDGNQVFQVVVDTQLVTAMNLATPYAQHVKAYRKSPHRAMPEITSIYTWLMGGVDHA